MKTHSNAKAHAAISINISAVCRSLMARDLGSQITDGRAM